MDTTTTLGSDQTIRVQPLTHAIDEATLQHREAIVDIGTGAANGLGNFDGRNVEKEAIHQEFSVRISEFESGFDEIFREVDRIKLIAIRADRVNEIFHQ